MQTKNRMTRVENHDVPVSDAVRQLPDQGGAEDIDQCTDADKQRHGCCVHSVIQDQHIRCKGDENLFPGAVKELQNIEFAVFPVVIEPRPFDVFYIDFTEQSAKETCKQKQADQNPYDIVEDNLVRDAEPADPRKKDRGDSRASDHVSGIHGSGHDSQRLPGPPRFCNMHRNRAPDRHQNMLAGCSRS